MATREIPALWQILRGDGWLHVTGLKTYMNGSSREDERIWPYGDLHACVGYNNGMTVIFLDDGSVWLKKGNHNPPSGLPYLSSGAYVPCSNGEMPHPRDMFCRMADPFWNEGQARDYNSEGHPTYAHVVSPATKEELALHPTFRKRMKELVH